MNVTELTAAVRFGLKDSSLTDPEILTALNRSLVEVAAKFPLSLLKAEDTVVVTAGALSTTLPAEYHHNLWWVHSNTNNRDLRIHVNHRALEDCYPDTRKTATGPIEDVAVEENTLWVRPIPQVDETLALNFYRRPTALSEPTDEPSVIPDHLHEGLLVDQALSHFYDVIEDGVDGQKVNTLHYQGRYLEALAKLKEFYPRPTKQRPYIRRRPRFF